MHSLDPVDYSDCLESLKTDITAARGRAALAVNSELIHLYFRIGQNILVRQTQGKWGGKVIDRLSRDLRSEERRVGKECCR